LNPRLVQLSFVLLFVLVSPCFAVHWISSQTGPATWTYTLQIDPFDNFNITTSSTTITMTALFGVTSATGPTSSDFASNPGILNWTPQVLNGGTKVVWTITGGGTGNFPTTKHVFGFSITAASAANGAASFVTNGFQVDEGGPILDISGSVAGPTATAPATPAPTSALLGLAGLAVLGLYQMRRLHRQ
jgi:MYXO-CTERM domain-containing protein